MERLRQHLRRRSSSTPGTSRASEINKKKETSPRRLYITSNTPSFDGSLLHRFQAEGFDVEYLPFPNETDDVERDRKDLESLIHEREDDLEPGERYAVVAYNRPAYLLLLSHHQPYTTPNPFPLLCAFVAFYPNPPQENSPYHLPPSTTSSTTSSCYATLPILPIQIHLAGHQSQSLWEDPGTHPIKKRHRCHLFFYPESSPGFAESVTPAYDRTSARLAWSRSLDCLKRGFGWPGGNWRTPDPESVWEKYWKNIFHSSRNRDDLGGGVDRMMELMVGGDDPDSKQSAHVNCVPTMTGGSTPSDISDFYFSQFIPSGPPSQRMRLLSRTVGPDRVVDELMLSFEHTEEIPWVLPKVPPTGRPVRVPLVMAVSFCAGKIARHNIYWDQASVLVQIGLLDPALVPTRFQATGPNRGGQSTIERIPVIGVEAADAALSG